MPNESPPPRPERRSEPRSRPQPEPRRLAFDLTSRPWLPVRRLDGSEAELSLREVFAQATRLRRLVGDVPTQEFALLRLLLAILHDAIDGPADADDWLALWEKRQQHGLPADAVGAYLDEHREHFDLLPPAGPLQSWGAASRFVRRTTAPAPTKSGVIGLLAAAQGRDRAADLSDLAALRFGVRVDQPGVRIRDFQTAHHAQTGKVMPVSERFYLADAVFLAAVECEDGTLLADLHRALAAPVFLPYLGRRSCPPSRPVDIGRYADRRLEDVLATEEWLASDWHQRRRRHEPRVVLDILTEPVPGNAPGLAADTLRDQPLSFAPLHRRYGLRSVRQGTVEVPNPRAVVPSNHDPMLALAPDALDALDAPELEELEEQED